MNDGTKRNQQSDDVVALIAELQQEYAPSEDVRCPKCGGEIYRYRIGFDGDEEWKLRCVAKNGCDYQSSARPEDPRVVRVCEEYLRTLPITGSC